MKITKLQPKYKNESLQSYKLWYQINSISCQIEIDWDNQPYETNMDDAEKLFNLFHRKIQSYFNVLANSNTGEKSVEIKELKSLDISHLNDYPYSMTSFAPKFVCTLESGHFEIKSETHFMVSTELGNPNNELGIAFDTIRSKLVDALNLLREDDGLFASSGESRSLQVNYDGEGNVI